MFSAPALKLGQQRSVGMEGDALADLAQFAGLFKDPGVQSARA